MHVPLDAACAALGCTGRTLRRYRAAGAPGFEARPMERGGYTLWIDVAQVEAWRRVEGLTGLSGAAGARLGGAPDPRAHVRTPVAGRGAPAATPPPAPAAVPDEPLPAPGRDLRDARARLDVRLKLQETQRRELALQRQRGEVVSRADVVTAWAEEGERLRAVLEALPMRVAPTLVGQDVDEIAASLLGAIRAALRDAAPPGLPVSA